MEQVRGILVMALLRILSVLVLIIVCHADNHKKNFLVLGEGPTSGIIGCFGLPEKKV